MRLTSLNAGMGFPALSSEKWSLGGRLNASLNAAHTSMGPPAYLSLTINCRLNHSGFAIRVLSAADRGNLPTI